MENITASKSSGLWEAVKKMFFRGLENLFDGAMEYQTVNGILQGYSVIKAYDDKGTLYTVSVKLSPLEGKESTYLISVSSDDFDNFDGSLLDGKVLKIDKDSKKDFSDAVRRMLDENGLSMKEESSDEDKKATSKWKLNLLKGDEQVTLVVIAEPYERDVTYCLVTLECSDDSIPVIRDRKLKKSKLQPFLYSFIEDNGLTEEGGADFDDIENIQLSRHISVALKKVVGGNSVDVDLVSIHASGDVYTDYSLVEDVLDNKEFIDSLEDDKISCFKILDDGDDYVVTEIDEVDTSDTYRNLFNATAEVRNQLFCISCAVCGSSTTPISSICSELMWSLNCSVEQCAGWMRDYANEIPSIPGTDLQVDINMSLEEAKNLIISILKPYVETLDIYYVNLPHELQACIDSAILTYKQRIAELERLSD